MFAPIFIAGTGRCGTSILQQIFSKHKNIFALRFEGRFLVSEGGLLTILRKNNDEETIPVFREKILGEWYEKVHCKGTNLEYTGGLCNNIDRNDIEKLLLEFEGSLRKAESLKQRVCAVRNFIEGFYNTAMSETGKKRWLEKTPANILYMNELIEIFPHGKLIHIYRDGRDVTASIIANNFWPIWKNDVLPLYKKIRNKNTRNCAIYWRECLKYGCKIGRSLPVGRYMEIKLEDLISEPVGKFKEICNFVGEELDGKMLSVNLSKANIGRWKNTFSQKDRDNFKRECGDILIELGYETDNDW